MSVNHCVVTCDPTPDALAHCFSCSSFQIIPRLGPALFHVVFLAGHLPYNSLFMSLPAKVFLDPPRGTLGLCSSLMEGLRTRDCPVTLLSYVCEGGVLNQHKVAANFSIGLTNIKKFTISHRRRTERDNRLGRTIKIRLSRALYPPCRHNRSDFSSLVDIRRNLKTSFRE